MKRAPRGKNQAAQSGCSPAPLLPRGKRGDAIGMGVGVQTFSKGERAFEDQIAAPQAMTKSHVSPIGVARVCCIFFVMYNHVFLGAPAVGAFDAASSADTSAITAIKGLLKYVLGHVSVPLLSAVSGYLAADGLRRYGALRLACRKLRTLVFPLVFWSAVMLGAFVLLDTVGNPSDAAADRLPDGPMDWLNAVLPITERPANYPLYFLRDLFICFILIRAFVFLVDNTLVLALIVSAILIIFGKTLFEMSEAIPLFFKPAIPGLFIVGLALGRGRMKRSARLFMAGYRPILILSLLAIITVPLALLASGHFFWLERMDAGVRVLGVLFFWSLSLALSRLPIGSHVARLQSYIFFIFCSHAVAVLFLSLAVQYVYSWKVPDGSATIYFFLAPPLCLAAGVVGQFLMSKLFPRFTSLAIGSRFSGRRDVGRAGRRALQQ